MSNEKQEIIADIVAAMRNEGHAGDASCLEWVGAKLLSFADRIEDAAKREREAGAEAAQICGEIGEMIRREATIKESLVVGNAAELRAENARLRAALKPMLDISIDMNTSDLAMSMAIKEAKRIYNELQHA